MHIASIASSVSCKGDRTISKHLAVVLAFMGVFVSAQQGGPVGTLVASNMNDNTVTVIDAGSGRVIATLPTGEAPHEVAVSRDGRTALVSNYGARGKPGNTLTVIDIAKAAVLRTITLENVTRPHGMAFLPGDTLVAVTSQTTGAIALADTRSGKLVRTLSTSGRTPHMLGLTARADRAVAGNMQDGTLSLIDVSGRDSATLVRVDRKSVV